MPELHMRLLTDVIALGSPYPLVLTGGYAVRAHHLVNRPSQDLDFATENPAPMADIAAALRAGLEVRGWKVHALETAPLSARFTVADPATGQEAEWTDDEAFAAYGLDDATITALRTWPVEWADDLAAHSTKRPMIRASTDHVWTSTVPCSRSGPCACG
ncbi:nucleotidyl transferase AbiEii/AbiGii toxin family protein [Streptomyces sp. NPDC000931]|uniref:nucleotidyl transferase AbiEii/AbiGii toxin family protein n=1 Tax=Streptomyces sp. NPDC000931 TaxID=3154372 RepID=UPI00331AA603